MIGRILLVAILLAPIYPSPQTSSVGVLAVEPDAVAAINAERSRRGLLPYAADARLGKLASDWATSMARRGRMEHGDFGRRLRSVYPNRAGSENIAWGQSSASHAVSDWMASPVHRANILGNYRLVGVGSSIGRDGRRYWTANFVR